MQHWRAVGELKFVEYERKVEGAGSGIGRPTHVTFWFDVLYGQAWSLEEYGLVVMGIYTPCPLLAKGQRGDLSVYIQCFGLHQLTRSRLSPLQKVN